MGEVIGYKGIGPNAGIFVPEIDAFDRAAKACGIRVENPNAPLAGEFLGMLIDWYYSSDWIEVKGSEELCKN